MLHVTYKTFGTQTATVLCERITADETAGDLKLILGTQWLGMRASQLVSIKSVMTKMSKAAVKANHTRKTKP